MFDFLQRYLTRIFIISGSFLLMNYIAESIMCSPLLPYMVTLTDNIIYVFTGLTLWRLRLKDTWHKSLKDVSGIKRNHKSVDLVFQQYFHQTGNHTFQPSRLERDALP